ncbi:MAG: trigger factor [Candidatus Saccharibacteria bacterium]|nr:trigger factor [Candidatus Saccharibacteria bacterium]
MHIETKQLTDTRLQLDIAADADQLNDAKQEALRALQKQVKLQGFREGKAPLAMVEKSVDQNRLQSEFLEIAVNRIYIDAATKENLRPVSAPDINIQKFVPFTDLEIRAEVDVIGKIKLPDYTKIKVAKPAVKVTAEDVNKVLEDLRDRTADKKPVERAVKIGDEAVIDFVGTDEETGDPLQGGAGTAYPLLLGSNSFIPGFEDQLVGLKAGQEKTFQITFPADYGVAALQNRKVSFAVTVKLVHAMSKPKLDDEFAAKVGPFKALADLKKDIKAQLTQEKEQQSEREFENDLVAKIADKTTLAIPTALVDEELDSLERDERQNLAYRGQTWQEHLASEGVTENEHREKNRGPAEQRVKAGLMLSEIAEREKLEVTADEIDERINQLKGQYSDPQMQAELDKASNRRSIASRILTEKTLAKLKDYAQKA